MPKLKNLFPYIVVLILALTLRLYSGTLTILFTYDQARDAFNAQEILKGHLKKSARQQTFQVYSTAHLTITFWPPFIS